MDNRNGWLMPGWSRSWAMAAIRDAAVSSGVKWWRICLGGKRNETPQRFFSSNNRRKWRFTTICLPLLERKSACLLAGRQRRGWRCNKGCCCDSLLQLDLMDIWMCDWETLFYGGASVRGKKETKHRSGFFLATTDENDDLQQYAYLFLKE